MMEENRRKKRKERKEGKGLNLVLKTSHALGSYEKDFCICSRSAYTFQIN
jgi:hypothetical protein